MPEEGLELLATPCRLDCPLGEILDEAVLEIRRIDDRLKQIKLLLRRRPEQFFSKEDGRAAYDALSKTGAELDRRADRLRFRFEGDQLVDCFEGVIESSNSIFLALGAIKREEFEAADQEHVRQEIREFCEGEREKSSAVNAPAPPSSQTGSATALDWLSPIRASWPLPGLKFQSTKTKASSYEQRGGFDVIPYSAGSCPAHRKRREAW